MIAPVRIVPALLQLRIRNPEPLAVFPALGLPMTSAEANFGRIAVGLVAARLRGLIRHVPALIELLVEWHVGGGMVAMLLRYRMRDGQEQDEGGAHQWPPPRKLWRNVISPPSPIAEKIAHRTFVSLLAPSAWNFRIR